MSSDDKNNSYAERRDLFRQQPDLDDLGHLVASTYYMYVDGEKFLSPWNAKANNAKTIYYPPSKEDLENAIPRRSINEISRNAFIMGLIRFCKDHKGMKQLPTPHPSTHHSIHYPGSSFSIRRVPEEVTLFGLARPIKNSVEITLAGVQAPIFVTGLKINPDSVKYLIVRPKLSKLGTASGKYWEILFFQRNMGYIVDHTDSSMNPRYSGKFN
jgi:hypothetical protein